MAQLSSRYGEGIEEFISIYLICETPSMQTAG